MKPLKRRDQRTHEFRIKLTFNNACSEAEALRDARDALDGLHFDDRCIFVITKVRKEA
jgi:hypothetical protein